MRDAACDWADVLGGEYGAKHVGGESSILPTRALGVDDRKGSVAPGKDADILLLDDSPTVVLTMVKGQVVYQAKEREAL